MAFALAGGMLGSAAIGGLGSLVSSLIGSSASKSASQEQEQAALNNLEFQVNLLGINQGNLQPFVGAGQQASSTLSSLLNPGTASKTLQSLPGFQFASKWGTKTAENALSAQGLGGSAGPLATAISNYNNGLASQQFMNYAGLLQNQVNSGIGAGGQITGATANAGAQGGAALTSAGNAAASGTLGSANALSTGVTGASGSASNALLLSSLLGGGGTGTGGINGLVTAISNNLAYQNPNGALY